MTGTPCAKPPLEALVRKGQARRYLIHSMCVTLTALALTGCTRDRYLRSANKEVASVIAEKTPAVANMDPDFTIQQGPPPTLASLPINQQRPDFLGEVSEKEFGAGIITLEKALQLGVRHNRQYQSTKENLYLQALSLTLARYRYTPIFHLGGTPTYSENQIEITENGIDRLTTERVISGGGSFGVDKLMRTGGRIAVDFTTDFIRFVSNDSSWLTSSALAATVTQPLLRGAGYRVAMESLTQAERDLLYELRDFTRFRKEFSVDIVSFYFQVLQSRDQVRNAWRGYQSLQVSYQRERAKAEEGKSRSSEVSRLEESVLSSQQGWINSVRNYQQALDRFKIDLGLPTDSHVILDDTELDQLTIDHPKISVADAVKIALIARLDLINVADQFEDTGRKVEVAANDLQADLDLILSAGVNSRQGPGYVLPDWERYHWSAGVNVDLPFDRKAERNAFRGWLISHERARRNLALAVDNIKLEIQDGWRNLDRSKNDFEISEIRVDLSKRRVEEEEIKSELGRGLALDLVDAQNALVNSHNEHTNALVNHTVARLGFWRDMGILYIKKNGRWDELDYEIYN